MPQGVEDDGEGDAETYQTRHRAWSKASEGAVSPGYALRKVVSTDDPGLISPLMLGKSKDVPEDLNLDEQTRQSTGPKLAKRLSGVVARGAASPRLRGMSASATSGASLRIHEAPRDSMSSHHQHILSQVTDWLHNERSKRHSRKGKHGHLRGHLQKHRQHDKDATPQEDFPSPSRRSSEGSETSLALDKLEEIMKSAMSLPEQVQPEPRAEKTQSGRRTSRILRKTASMIKLGRSATAGTTSDTDLPTEEVLVPNADTFLDNSKTLSYPGSQLSSSKMDLTDSKPVVTKEQEAWASFKYEIVRITHTLRIKGWRHIPMGTSSEIDVERLTGATTNAVYVVSPPKSLPPKDGGASDDGDRPGVRPIQARRPPKLLLRIYGPQVEHLIDREVEMQILRRLARKRIGPRLFGTFNNGRFEEFLHAQTLKPQDLRDPQTSRQIAKRMRELHDGIELLDTERQAGPFVWQNWDKWVNRCERVVLYLDAQMKKAVSTRPSVAGPKETIFVCGTEWGFFKETIEKYRKWLDEYYDGPRHLRDQLVFAHNDTQYGNILRLEPPGSSPLLLPSNQHKQLVVIDFEYANANTPGFEFANHFTEWCYNYHDPRRSFACNASAYPSPDEQRRFIRTYLEHRPGFVAAGGTTPRFGPRGSIGSMSASASFDEKGVSNMLLEPGRQRGEPAPIRLPLGRQKSRDSLIAIDETPADIAEAARAENEAEDAAWLENETTRLMHETRLWRVVNSAQWVAWGVVQAQVPGLSHDDKATTSAEHGKDQAGPELGTDPLEDEAKGAAEDMKDRRPEREGLESGEGESEEFDYLSYATDRALFFWGDCVDLGLVKAEQLPQNLRQRLKLVPR